MKNTLIFTLLIFIVLAITSCSSDEFNKHNESDIFSEAFESAAQSQSPLYITLDEAKAIALNDAHFNEDEVVFVRAELFDGARKIYDIEFTADGKEWDYEINAKNGQIMTFDNKIDVE